MIPFQSRSTPRLSITGFLPVTGLLMVVLVFTAMQLDEPAGDCPICHKATKASRTIHGWPH
ncbi:MAG: hypothetical protein WDZ30_07290 [Cellvibrionaceae bacterium]